MEERGRRQEYMSCFGAVEDQLAMQGYILNKVTEFRYLGSTLSSDGDWDIEVKGGYNQDG